ncbi:hypothetical protein F5Y17DRAFT_473104 [Xylariaceae sp. FL0594]|nr:hypothetical protein F5Y17DRAFT_473104 [Xylariaceae sp. FL0594]
MPYSAERLQKMGEALAKARREKRFPLTSTPGYNVQATIDDYEALQRLEMARSAMDNTGDAALHPHTARMYTEIQRRIQDRDAAHGEVAAESNVRARLTGFANGTSAETGIYNLMRHAVQSVLRLNNLTRDSDGNIVDTVSARVVNAIRDDVQAQAARGDNNVNGVNMDGVMEEVFAAIENALGEHVKEQAMELSDITKTQRDLLTQGRDQVNAIAGHVKAIDSHVHAMGNNVSAMSSLVTSTNGNLISLTANVVTLQTVLNTIPPMVVRAVQEMLPEIIGSAIEGAITNELINRMQMFVNSIETVRQRERARAQQSTKEKEGFFGKLNFFKKRPRKDN